MRSLMIGLFAVGLVAIGAVGGWFYGRERLPFQKPPKDALVVVDGDTIKLGTQRLRVLNLDAPETERARCESERALGDRATTALRGKIEDGLKAGAVAIIPNGRFDKFRRPLVRIEVHGKDVANEMIADGLAREWRGSSSDWCGSAPPS